MYFGSFADASPAWKTPNRVHTDAPSNAAPAHAFPKRFRRAVHAATVPTDVLMFAEKVGVISIARRDVAPAVLADVNKALDIIAATMRVRAKLDAEPAALP